MLIFVFFFPLFFSISGLEAEQPVKSKIYIFFLYTTFPLGGSMRKTDFNRGLYFAIVGNETRKYEFSQNVAFNNIGAFS